MSEQRESDTGASAVTVDELRHLAEEYREAETRLAKAKRAVEADKARRIREGVLAQLSDALQSTPEEWELGNATRVFDYARQFALEAVVRWMAQRPVELAQRDVRASAGNVDLVRRYLSLHERRRRLKRWHDLVVDTRKRLEQSASSSSGPGLMFYVGIATGNPLLTALSAVSSIAAGPDDHEEREAIARLGSALRRHLSAAQRKDDAVESLEALELHLTQLQARLTEQLKSASAVIAPYEGAARSELPAVLQTLARLT